MSGRLIHPQVTEMIRDPGDIHRFAKEQNDAHEVKYLVGKSYLTPFQRTLT